MPVRPVVCIPDPILATPAGTAGGATDRAVAVAVDLLDTMRATGHSVGIAAPQIGEAIRVFVLDVTGARGVTQCHGEFVMIDPSVIAADGAEIRREGCMSVPDLTGDVERATSMVVQGLDLDGRSQVMEFEGFEARAVQHELDHLDGHVFLDRVVSRDRVFRRTRYR